ncbi:chaperone ClpB domain protein, partial [Chlamydia psittaci 02DC21]
ASKIKYVLIPELQKTLKNLEEKIDKGNRMVKEIVDAEQVASIVSK